MNQRALAAEFIGTFMLMASVLGGFYSFGAPAGPAGIIGVALSIGFTVMALAFAIGHISGGHFNPAVTLGLIAGGRVAANSVFLIETVLTAFLVFVIMGATNRRAPAGFAPIALGATLAAIHIMAIPISNASVNPARSLGSALFGGTAALSQLWLFWVAPILGGVIGGALARWLQEE
jgi:aquaporin Z